MPLSHGRARASSSSDFPPPALRRGGPRNLGPDRPPFSPEAHITRCVRTAVLAPPIHRVDRIHPQPTGIARVGPSFNPPGRLLILRFADSVYSHSLDSAPAGQESREVYPYRSLIRGNRERRTVEFHPGVMSAFCRNGGFLLLTCCNCLSGKTTASGRFDLLESK